MSNPHSSKILMPYPIFLPFTGDITQKGYEKKRQRLLAPYISATAVTGITNNNNGNASTQGQGESRIRDQFAFVSRDFAF